MSDAALNGIFARLVSIEAQAAIVSSTADNLLRLAMHHVPGDIERHESHSREAQTLHTLTRSALHAIEKLCDRVDSERNRRITDRLDGAMPKVHTLVIGGKRAEDPPLSLTFNLAALERA